MGGGKAAAANDVGGHGVLFPLSEAGADDCGRNQADKPLYLSLSRAAVGNVGAR